MYVTCIGMYVFILQTREIAYVFVLMEVCVVTKYFVHRLYRRKKGLSTRGLEGCPVPRFLFCPPL